MQVPPPGYGPAPVPIRAPATRPYARAGLFLFWVGFLILIASVVFETGIGLAILGFILAIVGAVLGFIKRKQPMYYPPGYGPTMPGAPGFPSAMPPMYPSGPPATQPPSPTAPPAAAPLANGARPAAPAYPAPAPYVPPPSPPPPPSPLPPRPPFCAHCGRPTTFIPQYGRYFCYGCRRYV